VPPILVPLGLCRPERPNHHPLAVPLLVSILGAFAILRKAGISLTMSVRMEQIGFHPTDFHEI
jgi:hypothetical protein